MIFRLTERDLKTKFGNYREILYYDGQAESIAIVMGDVENGEHRKGRRRTILETRRMRGRFDRRNYKK